MGRIVKQPDNAPPIGVPERATGNVIPDRLYMLVPNLTAREARVMADRATEYVRSITPKLSGQGASSMRPYYGSGYFGFRWTKSYLWYQNAGISAFTMHRLAGKTIPMWIDDPTGEMARANPKAKTRMTTNGRRQVLIFRRAAKHGQRKQTPVRDRNGRLVRWRETAASYPGAPGRIAMREWQPPSGTTGKITRTITRQNVGVRWRHPGIAPREFMQHALEQVAAEFGIEITNQDIRANFGRH